MKPFIWNTDHSDFQATMQKLFTILFYTTMGVLFLKSSIGSLSKFFAGKTTEVITFQNEEQMSVPSVTLCSKDFKGFSKEYIDTFLNPGYSKICGEASIFKIIG